MTSAWKFRRTSSVSSRLEDPRSIWQTRMHSAIATAPPASHALRRCVAAFASLPAPLAPSALTDGDRVGRPTPLCCDRLSQYAHPESATPASVYCATGSAASKVGADIASRSSRRVETVASPTRRTWPGRMADEVARPARRGCFACAPCCRRCTCNSGSAVAVEVRGDAGGSSGSAAERTANRSTGRGEPASPRSPPASDCILRLWAGGKDSDNPARLTFLLRPRSRRDLCCSH